VKKQSVASPLPKEKERKTMTQQDHTNDTVPQSGRAAIYARVAPGARTRTTRTQTETLIELANEQGYPNERIIVYEDIGVSARKPLARRGAWNDLVSALTESEPEQGHIQTILAASVDRLFRDANATDITLFVQTCTQRGVQLVTPEKTYDFSQPDHVALFRSHCERSTMYRAQRVHKILRRNRMQGGRR
jgi:DNA invertase Pin-like site-specific DNA recombinase